MPFSSQTLINLSTCSFLNWLNRHMRCSTTFHHCPHCMSLSLLTFSTNVASTQIRGWKKNMLIRDWLFLGTPTRKDFKEGCCNLPCQEVDGGRGEEKSLQKKLQNVDWLELEKENSLCFRRVYQLDFVASTTQGSDVYNSQDYSSCLSADTFIRYVYRWS